MSDLDAGVLAQKLGIGPERVEKALSEMGVPYSAPPAEPADEHGVVGVGADLEPGTLLAAYRAGLFPMPVAEQGPIAWWSPDRPGPGPPSTEWFTARLSSLEPTTRSATSNRTPTCEHCAAHTPPTASNWATTCTG